MKISKPLKLLWSGPIYQALVQQCLLQTLHDWLVITFVPVGEREESHVCGREGGKRGAAVFYCKIKTEAFRTEKNFPEHYPLITSYWSVLPLPSPASRSGAWTRACKTVVYCLGMVLFLALAIRFTRLFHCRNLQKKKESRSTIFQFQWHLCQGRRYLLVTRSTKIARVSRVLPSLRKHPFLLDYWYVISRVFTFSKLLNNREI